jgi:hypothetical protein
VDAITKKPPSAALEPDPRTPWDVEGVSRATWYRQRKSRNSVSPPRENLTRVSRESHETVSPVSSPGETHETPGETHETLNETPEGNQFHPLGTSGWALSPEKFKQFQEENQQWWVAAEADGTLIIHGTEFRTAVLKNSEDALAITQEATNEYGDDQVIMLRPGYVADLLYFIGKLFPEHFWAAANALQHQEKTARQG